MHRLHLSSRTQPETIPPSELEERSCVDEPELLPQKLNGHKIHRAGRGVVKRRRILDLRILENGCVELGCFFSFFVKPQVRRDCLHGDFWLLFVYQSGKVPLWLVNSIADTFAKRSVEECVR